jgi:TolB-like protein/DNA-binding winged helix-turn-helix (wHTH) protein/tetratricopeptide (TPR) repeat protein
LPNLTYPEDTPEVCFGVFRFHPGKLELSRQHTQIRLQTQPARLLRFLLSRPGNVVTREEIRQTLWPDGTTVDFDMAVNRCIRQIREVLGDDSDAPRYIKTIPRIGYCFIAAIGTGPVSPSAQSARLIAPIEEVPSRNEKTFGAPSHLVELPGEHANPVKESGSAAISASPVGTLDTHLSPPSPPVMVAPNRSRRWIVLGAGLAAISLIAMFWIRSRQGGKGPVVRIRSLAVMPLQTFSDDHSKDYFADGMTEALITKLAQQSSLRVISRTSVMRFKNTSHSLPKIARELNVDGVIEGSVLLSGNKIRITVQLLNAPLDQHVWAETFERDYHDVIALQDDVSRQIATEVNQTLNGRQPRPPSRPTSIAPKAYEAYIRGRYLFNQGTPDSVKKSLLYFEETIAQQPDYALAYSGLAQAYLAEGNLGLLDQTKSYDVASQKASKSLQLDPSLSDPHATLGDRKAEQDWDWTGAEQEYRQAIRLEPSNSRAHCRLSSLLSILKRHDEAISEAQNAVQLDPLSPAAEFQAGIAYYFARRLKEAEETFKNTLEMNAASIELRLWLCRVYLQEKNFALALAEYQRVLDLAKILPNKSDIPFLSRFAEIYARTGKSEEAEALLKRLQGLPVREQSPPIFALACVALGHQDEAFHWLDVGLHERNVDMTLLAVEPGYDPIRSDSRLRKLLDKMNLPQ